MRLGALFVAGTIALYAAIAWAGTHTNTNWSTEPDGNGRVCNLSTFGACYYNFTTATDSPILQGGPRCSQIFTRVIEVTADIQVDIQACDTDPDTSVACTDLPNGTDITATGIGPEGGVATGIMVNVDTCTTCEGEVEAVCARP